MSGVTDPLGLATLVVALLAVAALAAVLVVWRSERRARELLEPRGADPGLQLLQSQVESLRGQMGETLQASLRLMQEQMGQALAQVNERLRENAEAVHQTHRTLGERLDNASRVVGDVQKSLGGLGEATARVYEVGKDIASLQEILRSPKLRGGIGELLLGELLSQILPAEHYRLQHEFKSGEKVDAVITIGQGLVPVDAKFPLEDFRRALDAESDAERVRARKAFLVRVRKHVDAIASKYILPDEGTYDFALMYVPAENVYYETIVRSEADEEGVNVYALGKRVVPVSPGSFFAYLQAILLGLRGLKVERQAQEILKQLARLQGDLDRFREDFRLVGRHLGNASSSYASAEKRIERFSERLSTVEGQEPAEVDAQTRLALPAKTEG